MHFMIRHFRAMAENEYAPNLNTVTTNDCQNTSAYSKGLFQERFAQNKHWFPRRQSLELNYLCSSSFFILLQNCDVHMKHLNCSESLLFFT